MPDNMMPEKISRTLPAMVREQVNDLPKVHQAAFLEEYRRRRKIIPIAYAAWFFLGSHYGYLGGRWFVQFIFWFTMGGLFLWWLFDAFRLPLMVRNHNRNVAIAVLRDMRAVAG